MAGICHLQNTHRVKNDHSISFFLQVNDLRAQIAKAGEDAVALRKQHSDLKATCSVAHDRLRLLRGTVASFVESRPEGEAASMPLIEALREIPAASA